MPDSPDLQLPPALEAFGTEFARSMRIARDRPARHVSRARRYGLRGRRGPLGWRHVVLLVFLAAGATAAAATIPLFGGSHRLTGSVPESALTSPAVAPRLGVSGVPVRLPTGLRYAIPVTPDLEAGDTGWCANTEFTLPRAPTRQIGGGTACAPASAHAATIVGGGAALTNVLSGLPGLQQHPASGAHPSAGELQRLMRDGVTINSFVVRAKVAQIRIGNASYVPRSDPELAPDWRAVVIFTRGPLANFELVDQHGRVINQTGAGTLVPTVPVTTVNPHHLPATVCSLGASNLAGVGGQWEVVADQAPTRGREAPADALFSCARAWYALPSARAVYSAAILLNAQNPAQTAPNLPGLTPGGYPGEFEEAASSGGAITAKREGNAWLLIQGPDQRQRTRLLNNITIAGTAIRH